MDIPTARSMPTVRKLFNGLEDGGGDSEATVVEDAGGGYQIAISRPPPLLPPCA